MSFRAYTGHIGLGDVTSEANRLSAAIRSVLSEGVSATLVKIEAVSSYDDGGWSVDVHPLVMQIDGAGNAVDHGIIHGLPVAEYRGGKSAFVIQPTVGDIGVALFCHNDISAVKRTRSTSAPNTHRRQSWSDGVYLMGILADVPEQYLRLDDSGAHMKCKKFTIDCPDVELSGKISTGAGSTFNGISFDMHTHGGVMAGGSTTGAPE